MHAIAMLSAAFIFVSGLLHFVIGNIAIILTPHAVPVPEPSTTTLVLEPPRPSPSPTPPPIHTPRPIATPQPAKSAEAKPRPIASLHPPSGHSTPNPIGSGQPIFPLTSPGPTVTPPATTPTPESSSGTPSGTFKEARFKQKVEPVYPQISIEQHAEGTVVILVTIGPDGQLLDARVYQPSGFTSLDEAALAAARASTYYPPPEVNGKPTTDRYIVIYTFQLQ